jgi:Poly-beta-hydroxybutyrate polymerase (PhaC) N-terminus
VNTAPIGFNSRPNSLGQDKRFTAPEWQDNPIYRTLKEFYLLASDWLLRSFIAAWAANFNSRALSSLGLSDSGWEGELCARLKQANVGIAISGSALRFLSPRPSVPGARTQPSAQ